MATTLLDDDGRVGLEHMVDVFKALGHPMRLEIMRQMISVDELACTTLEATLPISKPTISYHMKMLNSAGMVHIRKEGKFYFYRPRMDEVEQLLPGLSLTLRTRIRT